MTNPLILKLERRDHTLDSDERRVLEEISLMASEVGPDEYLVREHDRPSTSTLLLEGWACRHIGLEDGRRQIVAIHIPGDFVDLHSFPIKVMDHSVSTLTRCTIARVPHEWLHRITETMPHLTRLLWLSTLIDAAILRQWLTGAGRRSTAGHLAHLLCEVHSRLRVIGASTASGFDFPITQAELADILGVSVVHTNRVIQELRAAKLVSWRGTTVEMLDLDRLCSLAGFDPTYLNLEDERR